MKIRPLTHSEYPKVSALLRHAFPERNHEVRLIEKLHGSEKPLYEWICLQRNKAIAYIAFSRAFHGDDVCGLHLALLAVTPQMQNQGIGTELLNFALRQSQIREQTLFVLGDPLFFRKFGFERCTVPICPFDKNNKHFLSIRNKMDESFVIGYEAEFSIR